MTATFYVPTDELRIDSSLKLSSEFASHIDPVTYEVVRHNLWTINEEHGITIANVSGSPIGVFGHDFNPCLLTERGEFVYFGPYVQFFAGMADLLVKWILENRSENPGIHSGDMFLANDPLIATHHQSDVFLACPIFWQGAIFCWTVNALHQYDIGGNTPGSFCIDARDIYDEPVPIPPIKIVEGGELRRDVVDMYIRHSRMPDMLNLDLRAQIAGNNVARERVVTLLRRYGPDVVKGVMQKIIDDGERDFLEKLKVIPDGEWKARGYLEAAFPGDRDLYEVRTRLRKEGTELVFDNEGTHQQIGTLNTTFAGWRGAIMSVLNPFLCYEMLYAIGGALRHVRFEAQPGTILSVVHPGATSCSAAFGTQVAIDLAHECIVKMIRTSPTLREVIAAPGGHSQTAIPTLWGRDQRGNPYGTILLDHLLGSVGAFSWRDGVSTGGLYWDSEAITPNVEFNEQHYPILYLFRREEIDSGGAGRFRGGNSASMAFKPHRTEEINVGLVGAGVIVPSAAGLDGGSPGATSAYRVVHGSNVQSTLAAGRVPDSLDELSGTDERPMPKTRLVQSADDVIGISWTASGGYGDPLDRDPKLVAADVRLGAVSERAARQIYCVALSNGFVQEVETVHLRKIEWKRRADLGDGSEPVSFSPDACIEAELSEELIIMDDHGLQIVVCARCKARLSGIEEDFKSGAIREDLPLTAAGMRIREPSALLDVPLEFRCFYCPGCRRRLATEVARATDPVLHDVQLQLKAEDRSR